MNTKYAIGLLADSVGWILAEVYEDAQMMDALREMIGCELVEIVRPKGLPEGYVMVVDEEGLLKDCPKLNVYGSYLYEMHKHGHPIVGNAAIMKEEPCIDGPSLRWMTMDEAAEINDLLAEMRVKAIVAINSYVYRKAGKD